MWFHKIKRCITRSKDNFVLIVIAHIIHYPMSGPQQANDVEFQYGGGPRYIIDAAIPLVALKVTTGAVPRHHQTGCSHEFSKMLGRSDDAMYGVMIRRFGPIKINLYIIILRPATRKVSFAASTSREGTNQSSLL